MASPQSKSLVRSIHTWIGLIAGLVISVISVSGSLIVFRTEMEQAKLPRNSRPQAISGTVSMDEAARQVASVRPEARIRRVRLPASAAEPYIFQIESAGRPAERIVLDASSGQMLGTLQTDWLDWFVDLHRNLLSGRTGRQVVGAVGIVLFLLSGTGVLLWWIGSKNWRSLVSVRRQGSSRRFHFELHRATGMWAYCFLAVVSFTGIGISYPDAFRQMWQTVTGQPATTQVQRNFQIDGQPAKTLDEYLRIGQNTMPDGIPTELRLPGAGKGPVELRLSRAGDLSAGGNRVYIEPVSARVLAVDRVSDRPLGARVLGAFSPIHYGRVGGVPVKMVWVLLGMVPPLLLVTGLLVWWRPVKRKPGQAECDEVQPGDLALTGR